MLEILVVWTYLFVVSFCIGRFLCFCAGEYLGAAVRKGSAVRDAIAGAFALMPGGEIFSLFHAVDKFAVIFFAILAIACAIFLYRKGEIRFRLRRPQLGEGLIAAACLLWAVIVLFSTLNDAFHELHGDSDLYMAQAVRWTQEYGCVKGCANMNPRIGFNSALTGFFALASFQGIFGNGVHCSEGFLFLLFGFYGLGAVRELVGKGFTVSRVFRLFIPGYTAMNWSTASSYLTDTPSNLAAGFLLAEWMACAEEDAGNTENFALLSVFAVLVSTIKLSFAPLVLLTILPATALIKGKKWGRIALFLGMGILCILPFLLRNILISGYLLFPLESLDLFDLPWKLPADLVETERLYVELFAKAPGTEMDLILNGSMEWLGIWWGNLMSSYGRTLFLITAASIAGLLLSFFLFRKKEKESFAAILPLFVILVEMIYWFFSAPDYRFIFLLLYFFPAYLIAKLERNLPRHFPRTEAGILLLGIAMYFSYHPKLALQEDIRFVKELPQRQELLLEQAPFKQYGGESMDWYGYRLFYATELVGVAGDAPLPCTVSGKRAETLYLLGEDIRSGIAIRR